MTPRSSDAPAYSPVDTLLDRLVRVDTEVPPGLPEGAELDPALLAAWRASERQSITTALALLLVSVRTAGGTILVVPAVAPAVPAEEPRLALCDDEPTGGSPTVPPGPAVEDPVSGIIAVRHPETRLYRPPTVPRPPSSPSPPPATAGDIQSLKAAFEGRASFGGSTEAPVGEWVAKLERILVQLAPLDDVQAEGRLLLFASETMAVEFPSFPLDIQQGLVGWLVARLRMVQPLLPLGAVDRGYSFATAYMKKYQPGYVYGLSRSHDEPAWGWEEEADRHLAVLQEAVEALRSRVAPAGGPNVEKLLNEVEGYAREVRSFDVGSPIWEAVSATLRRSVAAVLAAGVPAHNARLVQALQDAPTSVLVGRTYQRLRKAIEEAREAEAEMDDAPPPVLPATWPWWTFTHRRRAVMVGGDPREPNRFRLQEVFQFAELEWVGAESKRNGLINVRDRVQGGKVDLVIMLRRFIGHDADQIILPACRSTGTPFVYVEQGYGVVRVRHGIERYLQPRM